MKKIILAVLLSLLSVSCLDKDNKASKESNGKTIFFENLKEGQEVAPEFLVIFGVKGMEVVPAGQNMDSNDHGHHHLIIDGSYIKKGEVVPSDDKHIHFGGGQTKTTVNLEPGPHTLTLQFANGAHISYGEELSTSINILVAKDQ